MADVAPQESRPSAPTGIPKLTISTDVVSNQSTIRGLPSRDATDSTIGQAYAEFILYCNPSVAMTIDTTELKKTFRLPPRADGKTFSTFRLFELVAKIGTEKFKTWGQLVVELGVEPPDLEKGQSTQKIQQYAVRLKRWMHAMHIDAFFEYLLGREHVYWVQKPATSDRSLLAERDGIPAEEDLALRALIPTLRPKRGRRRAEIEDADSDKGSSPAQRRRLQSPVPPNRSDVRVSVARETTPNASNGETTSQLNQTRSAYPSPSAPPDHWPGSDARGGSVPFSAHPQSLYPHSALLPRLSPFSRHEDALDSATTPTGSGSRQRNNAAVSSAWLSHNAGGQTKARGRPSSSRSPNTNTSQAPQQFSSFAANANEEYEYEPPWVQARRMMAENPTCDQAILPKAPHDYVPGARPSPARFSGYSTDPRNMHPELINYLRTRDLPGSHSPDSNSRANESYDDFLKRVGLSHMKIPEHLQPPRKELLADKNREHNIVGQWVDLSDPREKERIRDDDDSSAKKKHIEIFLKHANEIIAQEAEQRRQEALVAEAEKRRKSTLAAAENGIGSNGSDKLQRRVAGENRTSYSDQTNVPAQNLHALPAEFESNRPMMNRTTSAHTPSTQDRPLNDAADRTTPLPPVSAPMAPHLLRPHPSLESDHPQPFPSSQTKTAHPTAQDSTTAVLHTCAHLILSGNWFSTNNTPLPPCTVDEAFLLGKQLINDVCDEAPTAETFLLALCSLAGASTLLEKGSLCLYRKDRDVRTSKFEMKWRLGFGGVLGVYSKAIILQESALGRVENEQAETSMRRDDEGIGSGSGTHPHEESTTLQGHFLVNAERLARREAAFKKLKSEMLRVLCDDEFV